MIDLTTVRCAKPPQPEGVVVDYDSLLYGSKIRYKCQSGYTYVRERTGVCDESGLWTISPPDCQRKLYHIFIMGWTVGIKSSNLCMVYQLHILKPLNFNYNYF